MPAPELAGSADAPVGDEITNADEGVGAPSETPSRLTSGWRRWPDVAEMIAIGSGADRASRQPPGTAA